jgi:hypothetical protein
MGNNKLCIGSIVHCATLWPIDIELQIKADHSNNRLRNLDVNRKVLLAYIVICTITFPSRSPARHRRSPLAFVPRALACRNFIMKLPPRPFKLNIIFFSSPIPHTIDGSSVMNHKKYNLDTKEQ